MRAIVLSSGGSRGNYHIGALKYIYTKKSIKHEIYCGNSVGALVASFIAQYPYGQEHFAIERLAEIFLNLDTDDIHTRWTPFGILTAFLRKRSFRNSEPLKKLIKQYIDPLRIIESGKTLRVGATSLQPIALKEKGYANYRVYTELEPYLLDAILASASISPFLPPVTVNDKMMLDGGIQTVTPIKSAIEAGATTIDIVVCYPRFIQYPYGDDPSIVKDLFFVLELLVNRLTWVDIDRTLEINKMVREGAMPNKREVTLNIVHPAADLNVDALSFEKAASEKMQQKGWADAELIFK